MVTVTKASSLENYVLRLEFSDGVIGDVDCSFLLDSGIGTDLREPSYFRQVTVDPELGTVVWPNGLDPAPELLRHRVSTVVGTVSTAA